MKVGVIVTDSVQDMAEDLRGDGIDITSITIQPETSLKTYQAIASFMNDSKGYDLIHTIGSAAPLLFSGFVETPMLTTIHREPTAMDLSIYRWAPGNCFFIAAPSLEDIEGLNTLGDIDPSQKHPGRYYRELYERIITMCSREDHRPWGYYEVLSDKESDHKVKRITVWPKKRLSLQMHNKRKEHWIVISGRARVTVGKDEIPLGPSGAIDIPVGAQHRIENIGDEPLVFIEVQQGDYFGEDDIIRLADDFGRA
jgi:mannose-6-phosphate isomerase-like protein (cupin superfamily)